MKMITSKQQQAAADVLRTYLLSDALKPQYDGMSAYFLAGKVLQAAEDAGNVEMVDNMASAAGESEKENYRAAH